MRRALFTSVGLMLVRRRLRRQGGPGAAVALVGLQLFGPSIFRARRVLVWALALTVVGGIVVAALWWWRRGRRSEGIPEPFAPEDQAPWAVPDAGPLVSPEPEASSSSDWAPDAA